MSTTPTKSLIRSLGLGYVIIFILANILGSGIYKKVAPMADQLGSSGWVLVAWVLGGIVTIFGALSNAEVAGMLADTGGEYAYYKKIYNRFLSFMFGWTNFSVIFFVSYFWDNTNFFNIWRSSNDFIPCWRSNCHKFGLFTS